MSKWIMGFGAVLLGIGGIIWLFEKLSFPIGRLPGDLFFKGEKYGIYFPWVSSLFLSIFLTILLNFLFWIFRR